MAVFFAGFAQAQDTELQVELTNKVGTETSRRGDLVSARILSPASLQGDVVEGKIVESTSGSKSGGQSVLDIDFDMLQHGGTAIPINSQIKSASNSKGKANVDEDGRVIGRAGSPKKSSGLGGLGRTLGGLAGGRGAQIGGAVEAVAGAAMKLSADAPNLRFDVGSKFVLNAKSRSGPALASLTASQPAVTAAASAPPATAAPVVAQESASGNQPDFTVLKDEFIPGDNTIFFDDFSDMSVGDAPPHFKVRGASPDLMASGATKQLMLKAKGTLTPNLTSLPKNFTYEVVIQVGSKSRSDSTLILSSKGKQILHWWMTAQQAAQDKHIDLVVSLRAPYSELGRKRVAVNLDQPVKLAVWIQNGRMRSYINGEKHLDFNQVELPPIDGVDIENGFLGADASLAYRMVRFAESTPDFSQIIASSGRYIVRGILFDTDSDVIKPESGPVIKQIARGLTTDPSLKLLIEGHTDSVGDAAHNMDLSKRRAEAVKSVLVSQFAVDASRLTSAGLGSTKPVDKNDTPQGRAQNRRVELVKQ
jgi:outer membrane protein OmpA-like peptidoglycan-associated protein